MTQSMSKIWTFLNTENADFLEHLGIIMIPIENYLIMSLFLIISNINSNKKQKLIYISCITIYSLLASFFVPSPFNVLLNFIGIFLLAIFAFNMSWLKTLTSLILASFVFGLCNVLLQNPYITLLHINQNTYLNTPIYRISYLLILYSFIFIICVLLKNLNHIKLSLNLIDGLDKKTKLILLINLLAGLLTFCIQLVLTAFYIETLPIIITILNFIFLMAFLLLSIYSFSRVMKLSMAQKDLRNAEEYNASLEILYDNVKGFKHDFESIVFSLGGYLDSNDIDGAKKYFEDVKKDCKYTSNLSVINPRIINEPAIYSLLTSKYSKAQKMNVEMNIKSFLDLSDLDINMYKFSRTLGILIDNAIEAASSCKNKKSINIIFRRENNRGKSVIIIENTYSNKDVNISEIFNKGFTEKDDHSGRGLWEVKKYIDSASNLKLSTYKNASYFSQKLEIFDEVRNLA